MSFLSGLFLLGLPLAAIPLVIHMMKRRQRDVVPWGAMQFLREPTRRGQRLSQMDRWLLLAARILMLLCLIGALAQPLFHWTAAGQTDGMPRQLILVDDTRSTLASDTFDKIRSTAKELIQTFPEGTPIDVWAVGEPPRRIATNITAGDASSDAIVSDAGQVISMLTAYAPRGGGGHFTASVRSVIATTSQTNHTSGESKAATRTLDQPLDVWLVCDETEAGWEEPLSASAMVASDRHRLHIVPCPAADMGHYQLAVAKVESTRRAIAKNETVGVSASVVNYGRTTSPSAIGVWERNGEPFAQSSIKPLPTGGNAMVHTELSIAQAGTHGITFTVQTVDAGAKGETLVADNGGQVVVQVIGEMPMLVITERGDSLGNHPDEKDYLTAALGRNLGGWKDALLGNSGKNQKSKKNLQSKSLFRPVVRNANELKDIQWEDYPIIAWLGCPELPPDATKRLIDRVRQGAGLWVTLGAKSDRGWVNEVLGSGGLGIVSREASNRRGAGSQRNLGETELVGDLVVNDQAAQMQRLHPPEVSDPILSPLSDTERLDLDKVRIRRRLKLRAPQDNDASRMLLRTFEGETVAMVSSVGRGSVVIQSFPMHPSWSNFPLSKSFVVWVLQILDHLSQPVLEHHNLEPGQMFRHRVASINDRYEVQLPQGEKEAVVALPEFGMQSSKDYSSGSWAERLTSGSSFDEIDGIVRFTQADRPGMYRLHNRDNEKVAPVLFAVSGATEESNLLNRVTPALKPMLTDPRIDLYPYRAQMNWGSVVSKIPRDATGKSNGKPIWPVLLFALLVTLGIETFLAGYAALRRYGRLRSSGGSSENSASTSSRSVNEDPRVFSNGEVHA